MVIDTSAMVAILLAEPERVAFNAALQADGTRLLSAATYLESMIVIGRRTGPDGVRDLKLFVAEAEITIVPVTREHAEIAEEAFRRYGRGNHPAGLNYGDCFAYALAKAADEPLLFKGEDFARTDVARAG